LVDGEETEPKETSELDIQEQPPIPIPTAAPDVEKIEALSADEQLLPPQVESKLEEANQNEPQPQDDQQQQPNPSEEKEVYSNWEELGASIWGRIKRAWLFNIVI
jgi:hypothetical protein